MAPQYKLRYFNSKGAAEPIRLILAYANVPYEDIRMTREEWNSLKPSMPWGQLPVLEIDGQILAQSGTIARFLARKYGLMGETEFDTAKVDEYNDAITDLRQELRPAFYEQDEAKKEELKKKMAAEVIPKYFDKYAPILEKNGSGYLVGKKLTYADILLAHIVEFLGIYFSPTVTDKYPGLKKHHGLVTSQPGIKEWIAKRPQTEF